MPARIVVNGTPRDAAVADGRSLLDWLRDTLGLTGAKYACGEAACGACSVLVDGVLARACTVALRDVVGTSVTTVEGLASDGRLNPVQRAVVDAGALQCGFCTPGMVVAATALLQTNPRPTRDEVVQWMAPNVCRCCTYPRLLDAIERAAHLHPSASTDDTASGADDERAPLSRPLAPWDLVDPADRDWFDVLGDGLVVVAAPPPAARGTWSPTGGAWVHVAPDGTVHAFTGKVEFGQGTRRALRLLVAEELGTDPDRVRVRMGDTDTSPFDMGTFGSMSMPTAAPDVRRAAAGARALLGPGGAPEAGTRRVEVLAADVALRSPDRWRVAGHEHRRGDRAAVTGAKRFPSDVRVPGMLFAKVLHPPRLGATLRSVDVSAARAIPGVTVVVDGGFVGTAAESENLAREAIDAVRAEWEPGRAVDEELEPYLRSHPASTEGWGGGYESHTGDVGAALSRAHVCVTRTYTTAYLAHAPLETRVAVARWDGPRVTVWTGTQRPFAVRSAIADALDMDERDVRVVVPDTGAGFGGKHEPDVAIPAARLARAAGAPVRLRWTREEEFTWAYFRPAAVIDVTAAASSDGLLTAWDFCNLNSGSAAITVPYRVPNQQLRFQPADSPLRQGSYRALAATANTFARESCVDEIAHELGLDPVELRLRNLDDERLATVVRTATDRFDWTSARRGRGEGVGVACGLEKGGRVATCAHVRVDGEDVDVLRIVTAFEAGAVVDPDNLVNQIEGATVMGLGGALFEAVHFDGDHVVNDRFSQYRVPRFPDVPPIDVVVVNRPDLPSAGAGETPIVAVAPALANAIFDATGRRLRSLPLLGRPDPRPAWVRSGT